VSGESSADGGAGRRPRGRPKVPKVTDRAAAGLSIENPLESLPASAHSILDAARAVLRERGFEGLTIEAVANEANVSRTLIPYHFGSRAGLVEILIDSLFHDLAVDVWQLREAGAPGRDLGDYLELIRREGHDVPGQRDFFELMVLALRDPVLSRRVADLFAEYRELDLDMAGIPAGAESPWREPAVGAVLQAIADGLALQAALDPDFDLDAAVSAAGRLLGATLAAPGEAPTSPP
jgi:AcrR family transcriptional regulator